MITKNLKYLRRKHKLSQQALSEALDIPRTTLGDYERGKTEPNIQMLINMADQFNLSVDDLIRQDISHKDLEILRNKDLRVLAISVDHENRENIELVDSKAEAGYLDSFHDPEYIRELPKLYVPTMPQGTYRAFEIQGESMLPMESGSIVICEYVENIRDIKELKTYVVISQHEGLVYKRLRVNRAGNALTLMSDNPTYAPYEIPFEDIQEIWQYYAHISFSDEPTQIDNLLGAQIEDIQHRVINIESRLRG